MLVPFGLKADTAEKKDTTAKGEVVTFEDTTQPATVHKEFQTLVVRETKTMELTGSRIPREVKRVGRVTDGPQAVTVIDREQILRTGAQTVGGILASDPAIVIRRR